MLIDRLLHLLADGKFHSGEELGRSLSVSRTAIWKQIKKIESMGIKLESVKGRGYCLPKGMDLLSEDEIRKYLSDPALSLIKKLDLRTVVDSTNTEAMAWAARDGGSGYVCSAEQQTAGRGRRGRIWHSPYGCNIYFSVVWRFAGGAGALEGLSLAVGVAVVGALKKCGLPAAQLKWPNDVLYSGRKLAGILLEMSGDASGFCQVVVGVGVNVNMTTADDINIDQPWISVAETSEKTVSRNELLAMLLDELLPMLSTYEQKGFAAYRDRWMALDVYQGEQVRVLQGVNVIQGFARGVDEAGALLLENDQGILALNGGEVSLRAVDDSRM